MRQDLGQVILSTPKKSTGKKVFLYLSSKKLLWIDVNLKIYSHVLDEWSTGEDQEHFQ